ncbi:MAG: flippase-like domain-containing protein [Flavobacteriales bacterium]|nr:flippase-like domain-containing protein [Flavobacteriales bacterium]
MKQALINTLKVAVPLALGVWLVVYFYRALAPEQREQLFEAFRVADMRWLWLSLILAWLSHVSRAWRWRYLLDHLDHRPGFWPCYHAVMVGYFMNMLLPRAGEASRAALLYRTDDVPFAQGFGTILAERAVDMVMLLGIAFLTLWLQVDKIALFQERIAAFRAGDAPTADPSHWRGLLFAVAVVAVLSVVALLILKPTLRHKLQELARGFLDGLRSVLHTRHKLLFVLHTLAIWGLYLLMFRVGFYCLPSTAEVPLAGVLAGFIAGSIGIILVQGGIGAYPAFVALIVTIYMGLPEGGGLIQPDALAMGWLLWFVQTILLITLGGVSLLLAARQRRTA